MKKYGNKIVYDERYWEITRKSDHLYNVKYNLCLLNNSLKNLQQFLTTINSNYDYKQIDAITMKAFTVKETF